MKKKDFKYTVDLNGHPIHWFYTKTDAKNMWRELNKIPLTTVISKL